SLAAQPSARSTTICSKSRAAPGCSMTRRPRSPAPSATDSKTGADVASVQRRLGALGHLLEDPFDNPHGFIDETTTNGIKAFQRAKGLFDDGWMAPRGETERALGDAVSDLARAKGSEWFAFADRIRHPKQAFASE